MANRQAAGKNKAGQQHQFGLKEAYTVLQRDYLELKKAYIGNEQQLTEVQEQYLILQQAYQELQQDSQDQQATMVEKLEKSYDAYNEKFMKVEELEEELKRCRKNLEEIVEHNENQMKVAAVMDSMQDQLNRVTLQKQVFEEAVQKSLENVGLSLVAAENSTFQLNILDYEKLCRMVGYKQRFTNANNAAKSEKEVGLEEANAFLQQTMLSLKDLSEQQKNELSRATDMIHRKTEECSKLKKEITLRKGDRGNILVERTALEKIVKRLSETSDFVVELKKTICDQNSWIDMLTDALNEYKNSAGTRHSTSSKTAVGNATVASKHRLAPVFNAAKKTDYAGKDEHSVNGTTHKSNTKAKKAGRKIKPSNSGRFSGNKTQSPGALQPSNKEGGEKLDEGYVVVPSGGEKPAFEHIKITGDSDKSDDAERSSSFFPRPVTRNPVNAGSESLQHEMYHFSSLNLDDRRRTGERRFEADVAERFPQSLAYDTSNHKQIAVENVCPVCNFIFDTYDDLGKRRGHINSHFKD